MLACLLACSRDVDAHFISGMVLGRYLYAVCVCDAM